MAWEKRADRWYFYRRRRVAGRQVREYVGTGAAAEMAAALEQARQQQRHLRRQLALDERRRWEAAAAPLEELIRLTRLLLRCRLEDEGFRQHARGGWRRRRGTRKEEAAMARSKRKAAGRAGGRAEHLLGVLERARQGDSAALPDLAEALEAHPRGLAPVR
jgi:hypothetical protein